jgi:hypothetical protein
MVCINIFTAPHVFSTRNSYGYLFLGLFQLQQCQNSGEWRPLHKQEGARGAVLMRTICGLKKASSGG